jgi:hypothetical protein
MNAEIARREQELERDRGKYEKAKGAILDQDVSQSVLDLYNMINLYKPGDPPEKAIYVLAQLSYVIRKMAEPYNLIVEYERKRQVVKNTSNVTGSREADLGSLLK